MSHDLACLCRAPGIPGLCLLLQHASLPILHILQLNLVLSILEVADDLEHLSIEKAYLLIVLFRRPTNLALDQYFPNAEVDLIQHQGHRLL